MALNYSPVPKRLSQVRKEKGLSQKALGIQAGIDPSSASPRVNQYEAGKHTPDINMLRQLGLVLDVPVAYFYCEEDKLAEVIIMLYRDKKSEALAFITDCF